LSDTRWEPYNKDPNFLCRITDGTYEVYAVHETPCACCPASDKHADLIAWMAKRLNLETDVDFESGGWATLLLGGAVVMQGDWETEIKPLKDTLDAILQI